MSIDLPPRIVGVSIAISPATAGRRIYEIACSLIAAARLWDGFGSGMF
jgi:hypothetical protein